VVVGPVSLDNFPKKALNHIKGAFQKNTATGELTPLFTFNGSTQLGIANELLEQNTNGFVYSNASFANFQPASTMTFTRTYAPAHVNGVANYVMSSTTSGVTINVGTPGINPPTPGCTTATISITAPGQPGTCVITVSAVNGFAGTVTLACAVATQPSGAVDLPGCSFGAPDSSFTAPSTITLSASATSGNATMTVTSMAAHSALFRPANRPSGPNWALGAAAASLLCFLLLLCVPRERRRGYALLVVLVIVVVATAVSCGGGYGSGNTGGGNPGTTVGTSTMTVTATPSSGTAQTTVITVNVQ
jgi:hypothetical protein